jgi:hypothetical protein
LAPTLARHKYASNVVEACLKAGSPTQRAAVLDSLLAGAAAEAGQPPRDAAAEAASLARDQYGNYVLQRALEVAGDGQRAVLLEALAPLDEALRRSAYGKHIALRVARMLEAAAAEGRAAAGGAAGAPRTPPPPPRE